MLNKVYDICTENNGNDNLNEVLRIPVVFSILVGTLSFLIGVLSAIDDNPINPIIESWQIFFLTIFSWIAPALLLFIDMLINKFVMFVQDNEKRCPNFFYKKLFSEQQFELSVRREVGRDGKIYSPNSNTIGNAYIILSSMIFTALFIPYISMLVPILGYIFLALVTITGVIFGFLLICRKVVRLSKKLNRHVNDPDAHTRLKE